MAEQVDSYSDIEDSEDDSISELFHKATDHAKTLVAKLDSNKLLELYMYYKQATEGPCAIPRPRWYEMQAKAKWDAWNSLGKMSQSDARNNYVKLVNELDPGFAKSEKSSSWVAVSSHIDTDDVISDSDKTAFDHVKEGELQKLAAVIESDSSILSRIDENGMGLLHWTADRGDVNILKYLIKSKVDVNMTDQDGQTALHYAVSCDHIDCVTLLIDAKADVNIRDSDGTLPRDLTSDPKLLQLL